MRAFDALTVPNLAQYERLRDLGFDCAIGYTRVLTKEAVREALGLGMAVLPLIEHGQPTSIDYFTPQQGVVDGDIFTAWAEHVGMPPRVPFVGLFLDFDAPTTILEPRILDFVNALQGRTGIANPMWAYAAIDPLEFILRRWYSVAGGFQAFANAWSGGRNAQASGLADIVQGQNGVQLAFPDGSTITLDLSFVTTAARLWRASS